MSAAGCAGVATPMLFESKEPFRFCSGEELPGLAIAYETYGALSAAKDNAVLICHALSGSQHAAGLAPGQEGQQVKQRDKGWWDLLIGPGKAIDTSRFFVVCSNNIGGCHGSTGPKTVNPATGRPYGSGFPEVRVEDWVEAQRLLAGHLGVERFHAVVGGSIGGMQALSWAIRHPAMVARAAIIAGTAKLTTQNIAFNEIARQSIKSDPAFSHGDYYGQAQGPRSGLAIARMLGHVTYLSSGDLERRFSRRRREDGDTFEIESYLRYNGDKFADYFDANTYLIMTEALDEFNPAAAAGGDLAAALRPAAARFLVAAFRKDWRFPPQRSRELVKALLQADKRVSYAELGADGGHDAFLQDDPAYHEVVRAFLGAAEA